VISVVSNIRPRVVLDATGLLIRAFVSVLLFIYRHNFTSREGGGYEWQHGRAMKHGEKLEV